MWNDEKGKGARLGEVTLVKDCVICQREVILMAKRDMKEPLPPNGCVLPRVCEECRKKYLSEGILLICLETGSFAVLKDEAFKRLFDRELPHMRVARTDDAVIKKIIQMGKEAEAKA
jgi:hypothetical protein